MSETLTPDQIVYSLESVADPQLSPDGTSLLFTRGKAERGKKLTRAQVWRSDRDGGNARQVTQTGDRNSGARWSPDGRTIAFVSDRVKKSGLFLLREGGEAQELTRHNGSISELAWSPDGRSIAYTALFDPENPEEADLGPEDAPPVRVTARIDYKQDSRGYLDDVRPHTWVVDVESGQRRRLTSIPFDHNFPSWSPDSSKIALKISNHNGMQSQLGILDVESGELTFVGPEDGVAGVWAWSPSGDHILFAGDLSLTWQLDLFLYEVDSGAIRRLTDDLACLPDAGFPTVAPPSQPVWLDDTTALFHAVRAGKSGLYRVDAESGVVELVTDWAAFAGAPSFDASHRYVAQAQSSLETPAAIVVHDLQTGESATVTSVNQDLPRAANFTTFQVERGGETIDAWLLLPDDSDDEPGSKRPLVLDIHGGPNGHYGYTFNAIQQAIAGAGFAVLYCNPRGSTSYGRAFTQAVTQDWGGEDYLDLMAVVDAAVANPDYRIDGDRLGVYGYSYGGFMTSWIIGHTDRFKAAVIGAPVVNLVSFYGTSDIGHLFGPKQIGGNPWTNFDEYVRKSPLTYLHNATTPALIIHGEADDRCPISQGEECFVALQQNGHEVEFVRYPGGAHTLLRVGYPAHREDILNRLVGWFNQYLGYHIPQVE